MRSVHVVVHSSIDVKKWVKSPPSVDGCRPVRCPSCGAASRPVGQSLGLWGHGVRRRQLRGPRDAEGEPTIAIVEARRFLCRRCRATMTVLPRGAIASRHFSAGAIALACALYGLCGVCLSDTRRRVSPWRSDEAGWPALGRWLRRIEQGRLFRGVRPWPRGASWRTRAERVAATAMALAREDASSIEARTFAGASWAALA